MVYPPEMKGIAIGLHAAKFTNQKIVDKIKTMYEQCEPDRKMPNLATIKKWKKEYLTKGYRIKSIKKIRKPKRAGGAPKKMTPDMTYVAFDLKSIILNPNTLSNALCVLVQDSNFQIKNNMI